MGYYNEEVEKKDLSTLSMFGRRAMMAYYTRRYVSAIISGEFGKGKTAMSMWMANEIIKFHYNIKDNMKSLRIVLDKMIFNLDDLIKRMDVINSIDWESLSTAEVLKTKFKIREPVLIWDDVGIHGSKYKHFTDWDGVYQLQIHFDTIRDITSCMILTVPEEEELMKTLMNYRSNYFVELKYAVQGDTKYGRTLEFWKYEKDRLGRRKRRLKWTVTRPQSVYIPNEIYGEYDRMRTMAKARAIDSYEKGKKKRELLRKYQEMKMQMKMIKMREDVQEFKEKKMQSNDDL